MTRCLGGAICVWLLALLLALPAPAQTPAPPDMDAWSSFAEATEQQLQSDPAIDTLEDLRSQLATRRNEFLSAQDANAARIATVRTQISALGEPPADGAEPEPAITAERRDALNAQLSELRAPVIAAEEAYNLADGLIAQIDRQVRENYALQLLAREASPLNPIFWIGGLDFLLDSWSAFSTPVKQSWNAAEDRRQALQSLAGVVPLALISLLLIFRSRWWMRMLAGWAVSHTRRGRGVLFFFVSLGQIVLPTLGVYLLCSALRLTGLFDGVPAEFLLAPPFVALPIFVVKWLCNLLFRPDDGAQLFFILDAATQTNLRRLAVAMGYGVALMIAVNTTAMIMDRTDVAVDVVRLIPRLILAYLLVQMGRLLMRMGMGDGGDTKIGGSVFRLLGRLAIAAGLLGALLAAVGYSNAAQAMLIPAAMTLALTALVALLQNLVSDLYALLTGTVEGASEALAPLLIGFALILLAIPVYALIWGARVADLTEVWSRFRAGFAIGDTRISPVDFMTFALVFVLGYALTRFIQNTLRVRVLPKTRLDVGGRNAITSGVGYVGIFLAGLVAITSAGIDLSSLAIVAGALSVGIGFGLQNVVSNFVSGIILLIERPISEGDWIQVGDQMGYVRGISVRSTRIETFDRTDVIVPNADLVSNTVTNWTRGNNVGRVIVPVGVAYGSDTEHVERVLREIAEDHAMVILNPPPAVLFRAFGADSMDFEIRAILRDINFMVHVQSDMLHAIAKRFKAEGIEIPFAQRDVWLRNPEVLASGPQQTPDA